jgi:hypothetical protein
VNNSDLIIGAIQGLSGIILAIITFYYARLTKRIVDLQIEPHIEFVIPRNSANTTLKQSK